VSSILKALKKLEKEVPQQDEAVSWPQKIDTKKAISKHTKGATIFKKSMFVFFAAVLLAAGVWLFFSQKPLWMKKFFAGVAFFNQNDEEGKTASVQVRKKVAKDSVPVSRRGIIEKKMPRSSTSKISRPDSAEKDTGPAKKSAEPLPVKKEVDRKMSVQVRKATENTLKPVSGEETGIGERVTIPETKTSSPGLDQRKTPALRKAEKPGPGEMAEDKKFLTAKIMDDSKVELQAIAWSIDPKERIAVISGRVVREGATIEGFTITRIGKDEVFVMEGNEIRKLVFTIK
jgi:hypothetical protein